MNVAILTRHTAASCYVANMLSSKHTCWVYIEKSRNAHLALKKLRRFVRTSGLGGGLRQFVSFARDLPFVLLETRRLSSYLVRKLGQTEYAGRNMRIHNIHSVNQPALIEMIGIQNPDIVIVVGTRILSPETIGGLSRQGCLLVNWHAGITPEYRGCKSEFYCIMNGEIDMVGSTIHTVDEGLDIGKIIMQEKVLLSEEEMLYRYDYGFLRYKNVLLAADMLERLLESLRQGQPPPFSKTPLRNNLYSTITAKKYREYRALLRSLPDARLDT